jgi:heptosyltransferase II
MSVDAGKLVVLAPNWLGDAIMALPTIRDVAAGASSPITVAARASVAPLFSLVPSVSETIVIEPHPPGGVLQLGAELRHRGFETALLLPNSFLAAMTVLRARVPGRWGYRTDCRGFLLTSAIEPPRESLHQAEYYQRLVRALGFPPGPLAASIRVSAELRAAGARQLEQAGWDRRTPLVAIAPGAAYGSAKRWPAHSWACLARRLARGGVMPVLIGAAADAATGLEIEAVCGAACALNVIGRTDLPALAGVLAHCRMLVANDSGPMHFGAAMGLPVTAVFGPTDEHETAPLPVDMSWSERPRQQISVLTNDVECRPCMLRECPTDHRCMRGIDPDRVYDAVQWTL